MSKAKIVGLTIIKKNIMQRLVICLFTTFILSCNQGNVSDKNNFITRIDIRYLNKFYSFFLERNGNAIAIKGNGSYYTDTLVVESSDTSRFFKLDSTKGFFEELDKIKGAPIFKENRTGTAQRAEVYYYNSKIYDSYAWDQTFWGLFRPIMEQLPEGYNPFKVDNKPFE